MYSKNIIGLGGVRKKPTLKKGDVVEMKIYVAKRDVYGNPYNSGQVFLNNKLIGDFGKNWGGKDMGEQNAFEILEKTTFKPRGKKINFKSDYRMAGIQIIKNIKEDIPIRKFNKYYS